jgi:hypothetical protein
MCRECLLPGNLGGDVVRPQLADLSRIAGRLKPTRIGHRVPITMKRDAVSLTL